jgi:hypothetical protein
MRFLDVGDGEVADDRQSRRHRRRAANLLRRRNAFQVQQLNVDAERFAALETALAEVLTRLDDGGAASVDEGRVAAILPEFLIANCTGQSAEALLF